MAAMEDARSQVRERVRAEQLRLLYAHGVGAFAINIVVASLMVAIAGHAVAWHDAVTWCVVFVAAWAVRGALYMWRWRAPDSLSGTGWLWLFAAATFTSGAVWGLTAVWFAPRDVLDQFVVGVTIMGMVGGAAASISCVKGLYEVYLISAFIPVAIRFALENGASSPLIIALAIVYALGMTFAARTNHRLLLSSLTLRFRNEELARQLETLATRDPLTALPNRRMLVEQLDLALRRARRFETGVAVVFVDCDNFKQVNDTYGHAAGDEYLQGIARALQDAVREIDTVARLGGDEFIVMLDGCGNRAMVETIVRRIHSRSTRLLELGECTIVPQLSIGVSMFPRDAGDVESLIRLADRAMYDVKRSGGNDIRFATPLEPIEGSR